MLISLLRRSGRFLRCERAVSALEYAVMAGVVIAGVGAAIVAFTTDLGNAITGMGSTVSNITAPTAPSLTPPSP